MREIGTFALQIRPATTASPPRVSIVVAGAPLDEQGLMHVSPECVTLDELEGQLNGLQDELDVRRAEARQAFAETAGHLSRAPEQRFDGQALRHAGGLSI